MTLKQLREEKSLTQLDVAFKLGTTPTTVSNWERGLQEPRASHIPALAELYGVSLADIFEAIKNSKQ